MLLEYENPKTCFAALPTFISHFAFVFFCYSGRYREGFYNEGCLETLCRQHAEALMYFCIHHQAATGKIDLHQFFSDLVLLQVENLATRFPYFVIALPFDTIVMRYAHQTELSYIVLGLIS
ncbi:hypothetical protein SUGI_0295760 [Cryptomeria japonica]|nr:hypothetical protein SUGI_0295760 [Cryptomeria japonica]